METQETTSQLPAERQEYQADWWNPKNASEALTLAGHMAKSALVPSAYRGKPEDIFVAWSLGAPLGLSLLSTLRNVCVINGTPSIWGDAALAVCQGHPMWGGHTEVLEGDGDDMRAVCTVWRKGEGGTGHRGTFSVADAKNAKLWGKNVWASYPKRMLQMRARAFALRDAFADALCGMPILEEVRDITPEVRVVEDPPEGATRTEQLKSRLRGSPAPQEAAEAPETQGTPEPSEPPQEDSEALERREAFHREMATPEALGPTRLIQAVELVDDPALFKDEGFLEHVAMLSDKDKAKVREACKKRAGQL